MSAKYKIPFFGIIDQSTLLFGLSLMAIFYVVFFVYIAIFSASVTHDIELKLASQSVPLEIIKSTQQEEISNKKAEIPLLIEGLQQKTTDGILPVIRGSDNLTSFNAYKRAYNFPTSGKPILAVVVMDFGLSKSASETAINLLPPEVSYSISPYADMSSEWAKILRQNGREFWVNIPFEQMENQQADTGPLTIFTKSNYTKNQKSLHKSLTLMTSYVGASSSSPALDKENDIQFKKITEEIFRRGLGFLELNVNASNSIENIAITNNSPYIKADIELVLDPNKDSFAKLEEILNDKGHAVAVIQNYQRNIERLAEWILKVAAADYELAPVSAIYDFPLYEQAALKQQKISAPELVDSSVSSTPSNVHEQIINQNNAGSLLKSDKIAEPEHKTQDH